MCRGFVPPPIVSSRDPPPSPQKKATIKTLRSVEQSVIPWSHGQKRSCFMPKTCPAKIHRADCQNCQNYCFFECHNLKTMKVHLKNFGTYVLGTFFYHYTKWQLSTILATLKMRFVTGSPNFWYRQITQEGLISGVSKSDFWVPWVKKHTCTNF